MKETFVNGTVLTNCYVVLVCLLPLLGHAHDTAKALQQLSLSDAKALMLAHSREVQEARQAIISAAGAVQSADTAPNPTLSLQSININPKQGFGSGNITQKNIDSTIGINQLFERGNKRALRTETAKHLYSASQADLDGLLRQLSFNVSSAYFALSGAQETLRTAQENAYLAEAILVAAHKRKAQGDLSGADVERVRLDALRARNDAEQAQIGLDRARIVLARLLVIDANAPLVAVDAWPTWEQSEPEMSTVAMNDLIDAQPVVKAAQLRFNAAQTFAQLVHAQRTRDVSIGVQYEHYPASQVANSAGTGNSFGVSVQWPLFINNYFDGDIKSAEATQEAARAELERVRESIASQFRLAQRELNAAAAQMLRYQTKLLEAARKSADASEFAFKNGAIPVIDLLDARRAYRGVQIEAIAARVNFATTLAAWRTITLKDAIQ